MEEKEKMKKRCELRNKGNKEKRIKKEEQKEDRKNIHNLNKVK